MRQKTGASTPVFCYHKYMKRFVAWIAAALALTAVLAVSAHAGVNDFTINKFDADYYLGRDEAGRSTLKTIERITAEFPQFDQNHGLERALPTSYDGHPTKLKVSSVTDANGQKLSYSEKEDENGNKVLRIGEADKYVHGQMTYIITYEQRDVTRFFDDTGSDEFYWDINGTAWRQNFGQVTARIHADQSLRSRMSGSMACYYGYSGEGSRCGITEEGDTLVASMTNLRPGQNMTLAVGFQKGTFAVYEPSAFEKFMETALRIWVILLAVGSVIGFILIFIISFRYSSLSNRKKDLGTIVPEYLPPKETSVLTSSRIGDGVRSGMTAQIVDLAVRHYLKIYQTKDKSLFKSAEYELEIIKPIGTLRVEERDFLATLFGKRGTAVGSRLDMKSLKNDYSVAAKMQKDTKKLDQLIKGAYELRQKNQRASKWFNVVGSWTLAAGILTLSPLLLIAAIIALVCAAQLRPLTDKGLDLRRYLMGLKMYIGVAEEERLKMLQSPDGAEKVGEKATDDPKKLVKLYEKVLPYAILFGQEREWNKQLGNYYEQNGSSPDWYAGNAAFSAAVFSSAMNDFSTSTSTYAASTSSSSGGSSGGGSSGGGGGGGGGGGW